MTRLDAQSLRSESVHLRGFSYDRDAVTPGIVHLGIGAFHRAHMAVYVDDILEKDPSWGIVGASLRRPDTREALAPQDFLYTLAIRDASGTSCRVIGSLLDVLDANTQRGQVLEIMADPRIRIVSLTVTEKGYCHDPATGELDARHPDIVHDLADPGDPVSAPGLIVAAIARRRAAGTAPFAVMSCDNLPANGATTRRIVTRLAALQDRDLAGYITENVAFPGTMVDRIAHRFGDLDEAISEANRLPFGLAADHFTGAALPRAVEQRGMVQTVLEHCISLAKQGHQGAQISHVTAGKYQRPLSPGKRGQFFFEAMVRQGMATDQMGRTAAGAVTLQSCFEGGADARVVGKPQIVVAAKRQQLLAIDLDGRLLGRVQYPALPVEFGLAALIQPLLKDSINLYGEAFLRLNTPPGDTP